MVVTLFDNFLVDDDAYRSCEQFWLHMLRDRARASGQSGEWQSWKPTPYADGRPFERDGNPIVVVRSPRLNRAIRIVQHAPTPGDLEIAAWVEPNEGELAAVAGVELVINLSLSEETAELAAKMILKWMAPETSIEEMWSSIRMTLEDKQSAE